MPQREFELFLSLLGNLLKLSSRETAAIADEICDHLEERFSELVAGGVSADEAVQKALSEFEDANVLASRLTTIIRQRKRRRIMTGMLGTVAAAAGIMAAAAFWPDAPRPQNTVGTAVAGDAEADKSAKDVVYTDESRFLPASLSKAFDTDLENVTLDQFSQLVGSATGLSVYLDWPNLQEAGVGPDSEISAKVKGVPIYLAIKRVLADVNGVRLGWFVDDGVLGFSTAEVAEERRKTMRLDIRPLVKSGYEFPKLSIAIMEMTSGPWEEVDGEGGTISVFNNVASVRHNNQVLNEVRSLLAALQTKASEIHVNEPPTHAALIQALQKRISSQFENVPLDQLIQQLAEQAGAPIELDHTSLVDSGVNPSDPVTLKHNDVSLRFLLSLPINGVECAVVPRDGRLLLTTKEKADEIRTTVIYDVADLVSGGDIGPLSDLIAESTSGPWEVSDGVGGSITAPAPGTICIYQPERVHSEVRALLAEYRAFGSAAEPAPPEDPNAIEIRYYRLSEKTADDLVVTIPKFVAPATWSSEKNPTAPGLIQKVFVGTTPVIIGGMGGMMGGGMGGGGMGGGGGGFFQMGVAGMGGVAEAAPQSQPESYTVLVIRQSSAVHAEIRKFIRELVYGERAGTQFGSAFDDRHFTWKSELQVEPVPQGAPNRGEEPRGSTTKGARPAGI